MLLQLLQSRNETYSLAAENKELQVTRRPQRFKELYLQRMTRSMQQLLANVMGEYESMMSGASVGRFKSAA